MYLELHGEKEEVGASPVGPCVERKGAGGDQLCHVLLLGSWAWVVRGRAAEHQLPGRPAGRDSCAEQPASCPLGQD